MEEAIDEECFNPLDRGNLNQIRCAKMVSLLRPKLSFNPLDRGNLNQMGNKRRICCRASGRFNPLDRGNLNQIRGHGRD